MKRNIVVIGGGTGLSVLLRGLKTYPVNITAIVTVADDGGSSGILRKELDIPPPGDVRNVLTALAEVEPLVEELFQHRFTNGSGLSGHSLGNLLLAGMTSITGDFHQGIVAVSRVLNVRGTVLPAANQSIVLHAEMQDGSIISGESKIPAVQKPIKRVFLTPEQIDPLPESLQAIKEADWIVLGPGSLYTSVLPNLLVPGIAEAIQSSTARKVYICNVMTQQGETDGYSAADHLKGIISHCGTGLVDDILVNGTTISDQVMERYAEEMAFPVMVDQEELNKLGVQVIKDHFVLEQDGQLRHHAKKVSEAILSAGPYKLNC
ncbi:gluconeogenesis factor YvcK family protein [Alkalicoccobacillus porphyridii]|uniref:Gluconeogenesis factor n=1 Tax=Alkalicoccobacillus porphyridii TaxID=2597270 RepID=A0A554A3M0_9BACI|nr:YvcK family protein [Alkalicoccobacillus porphyridii]TSB48280.1 YvcK family protein [Alkalicoccobacillus porphyridii]